MTPMKIYAIAEATPSGTDLTQTHLAIVREGVGNSGDYPPCFMERERAQACCALNQTVVELELVTEHEVGPVSYAGSCTPKPLQARQPSALPEPTVIEAKPVPEATD